MNKKKVESYEIDDPTNCEATLGPHGLGLTEACPTFYYIVGNEISSKILELTTPHKGGPSQEKEKLIL